MGKGLSFGWPVYSVSLQYKSITVLDFDDFKKFIKEVYNLFDNHKDAINTLIAIFGHNY
jgi:hypothetical protein